MKAAATSEKLSESERAEFASMLRAGGLHEQADRLRVTPEAQAKVASEFASSIVYNRDFYRPRQGRDDALVPRSAVAAAIQGARTHGGRSHRPAGRRKRTAARSSGGSDGDSSPGEPEPPGGHGAGHSQGAAE